MIIDCHAHIASHKVLPPPFFDGWSKTLKTQLPFALDEMQGKRIDDLLRELNEDPQCTKFLKEMDAAKIDQSVLLVIDFGVSFKDLPLTIEELHLEHKKLIDSSDRFIAFSGVDPRRGREGLELFERAVTQWGFRGLKLYAPCGFSPSDRRLFPFYEICQQKHLPVLTHVGPTSSTLSFKRAQPLGVDEAARCFPNVNFILGHAGVTHYRQAGMMAEYRPNIYLDLSGFQGEMNKGSFRNILRWHVSRGLCRKLLFGTDWPIFRFWGTQEKWVAEIKDCQTAGIISEDEMNNIFFDNMEGLLHANRNGHQAVGVE
jgi:predicted TIM-barrel fold metal-dependent hydrolase